MGVVGRPHGVRGKMRVRLFNPESQLLNNLEEIVLQIDKKLTRYAIVDLTTAARYCLLTLADVTTREQALKLVGAKLCLEREAFPDLAQDEFYVADLIGLEAWDGERLLGRVASSRCSGGVEVVTIVGQEYEIDVPLVEDYVKALDIAGGRVLFCDSDMLPRAEVRRKK